MARGAQAGLWIFFGVSFFFFLGLTGRVDGGALEDRGRKQLEEGDGGGSKEAAEKQWN